MTTPLPHSTSGSLARSNFGEHQSPPRSTVSWGAIFAGATAALALHVLFMMLGLGIGLAIYNPLTGDDPMASLSIGALTIHSICAIISLYFGGWVAGRFSPVHARTTGWLHGFSVWGAATVGGVILVALGAGAMMGGLSKIIGGGLAAVGQPAAAAAGNIDLGNDTVDQSEGIITSFSDEAVGNLPDDRPASQNIRATREVGLALGRLFNPAREGNAEANRSAAVTALVDHTEMSRDQAERAVTEWTATYERLQDDLAAARDSASTQAREAADTAADALAKFSLWSFFGFLLGALAATGGGHLGAKCATKCDETTDVPHAIRHTSDLPKHQAPDTVI